MKFKEKVNILGQEVNSWNTTQTAEFVVQRILSGQGGFQVSMNTFKLLECKKSQDLQSAISNATITSADGMSIVWAARILRVGKVNRVAGVDLASQLIKMCDRLSIPIFLYGSTSENVFKASNYLKSEYPKLRIVGEIDGYSEESNDFDVIKQINESGAKLCLMALPSPAKELSAFCFSSKAKQVFFLPVGGAFEIFAGAKKRAPLIVQRIGMEWLFRMIQEPKRLIPRYFKANTYFLLLVVKALILKGHYSGNREN